MKAYFLSTVILTFSSSIAIAQTPACRSFEAIIPLQMFKDGCTSEIGLCTVGTVTSSEAALNGAAWKFTAHALAESAGLPSLPKTMQSYTGTVLVTGKEGGTFTTTNAGMFDSEAGTFAQLDKVTGGTGRFADSANRWIFLSGTPRQGGGGFDSRARGEVCIR
jgi:hypothetical protein